MPTPRFARGDIVNVPFPNTDRSGNPRHYALIVGDPLANSHGDYILIQITSTLWNSRTDFVLESTHSEFVATGLQHTSCFRCHKLLVLSESMVRNRTGMAGPAVMSEVSRRLSIALGL